MYTGHFHYIFSELCCTTKDWRCKSSHYFNSFCRDTRICHGFTEILAFYNSDLHYIWSDWIFGGYWRVEHFHNDINFYKSLITKQQFRYFLDWSEWRNFGVFHVDCMFFFSVILGRWENQKICISVLFFPYNSL